uniref:DNA 3'-5' helicase n=1 Tax=Candidatus Kentrum sp. TUN TaxID=2126343 RepID=A0A450ZDE6_9GAMM|nr:MAG: DNA helicase-2 / ATP-dependent DNA helicase PcrA [Candidatus Kentron sp. TUN]VFK53958.1 MAG: DNA helicase-2 / ATP-dependent DNA helicase PcrA [Candidatus Kentron sp. TUN]VFK55970.1 MAG: DNA helicase-2 / ATP-dependent DNA helicase PcrA [Candidatus Kentron sp. TUN]
MELNEQQKNAVTYHGEAKNVLVTAGAGCGKTRTIIARTIHLVRSGTDASRILLMTFTNRAAREIKSRLKSELGPVSTRIQAGTFHSFCLKIMTKIPKSFGVFGLDIIDSDDQNSLMTLVRGQHIDKRDKELNKEFPRPAELIRYYSYSRNTRQDTRIYLSSNTDLNDYFIEICADIFTEYQKEKKLKGYLDYDDLLENFTNTLREKPDLRKDIAKLFDEILVDEMQDTNPLQFDILKHFSSQGVRLFCVGDPAQSIYKFRGAEFRHVYEFDEIFGNSTIIPLSLNYRSYQEILDFSNWLLERSPLDYRNKLKAYRKEGGFLPSLCDFESVQEEASWIADKILAKREEDIQFQDIMILVRSGYDAKPIEAEFLRRDIPYYFIGGTSLTKAAHVRDVLSLLRIARNPKDDLAWMRFLKLWQRIGERTASRLINSFHEKTDKSPIDILSKSLGATHGAVKSYHRTASNQDTPKLCVSNAVQSLAPTLKEKYDKWNQRYQDLKLLVTVSEKHKTIGDFINAFTLEPVTNTEINKLENDDAVLLITVHSAKGTEAPICFLANAKPGTYPHSRSFGDLDSEEEERRVLYVALTRAKNELFITRSADRGSGFYLRNKPAEGEEYFLSEVPDKLVTREIYGYDPDNSGDLSSLEDIY